MRLGRTLTAAAAAMIAGVGVGLWSRSRAPTRSRGSSPLDLGKAVLVGASDRGVLSVAAAIAFYALSSLVPALSVLISLWGLLTVPAEIPAQLAALDVPIPEELRALIVDQARRIAATSTATLSVTLATSLVVALWSANAAVKAMFEGLDRMWDLRETRSFLRFNATTLAFTLVAVTTVAAMLAGFAMLPALQARLGGRFPTMLDALRWPVTFGLGFAATLLLYRRGPDRTPPAPRHQVPGALFATVAWVAASAAFSWYVARLGTYSATYGSLAGVVVALTWSWISSVIVLVGGAITASLEADDRNRQGE